MSRRDDFIQGEAELGSEEEDESLDGEEDDGDDEPRRRDRPSRIEDSSEEEDDDDDEEEAAKVRLDWDGGVGRGDALLFIGIWEGEREGNGPSSVLTHFCL